MACTPASSSATVPEPAGRVTAFSDSSENRASNVFTAPSLDVGPGGRSRPPAGQPTQRHDGRDGGLGRLRALVLPGAGQPGAVERLLLVVAGEQAEADRDARRQGDVGQ